jgi:CHAD domain-containing protein
MMLHDILRGHVEHAFQILGAKHVSDDDIHRARKELKKARAVLRLLRDGLRPAQYRRWNASLRDAARPLSAARDASVLLDTLKELGKSPDSFVRLLKREHVEAGRRVRHTPGGIPRSRTLLRGVLRQIDQSTGRAQGWAVLGKGLRRVYSQGRKAMRTAKRCDPEALHEWRKQTKYLWHQFQVLEPLKPGLIGELADQAHRLSDYLGADHDLSVLRDRITKAGSGKAAEETALLDLIARRQDPLREKAFVLGRWLYQEKPKALAKGFAELWQRQQEQAGAAGRSSRTESAPHVRAQ